MGPHPLVDRGKPKMQPINAKSETAATSGMFRQAMQHRRCLVPADGFYEWMGAKPPKQPFFIHMKDNHLFAFAGLWERWKPDEQSEPLDTFTILTTAPNELMRPLHNRMPLILRRRTMPAGSIAKNPATRSPTCLSPMPPKKWKPGRCRIASIAPGIRARN